MGRIGTVLAAAVGLVVVAALVGGALRLGDALRERSARADLLAAAGPAGPAFDPAMVADLPDPARRFFLFAIAPGTPLATVADIRMAGEIGLGDRDAPGYRPMAAEQILAPLHGFVWTVRTGGLSGSDGMAAGRAWSRFRLAGLVPVVRSAGPDTFRSAVGRAVAEGLFWTPAALLPSDSVRGEAVDADTARAVVTAAGIAQPLELTVAADGRPLSVVLPRWSRENPEQRWQVQPFGGTPSDFRAVEGYRLPFRVEGGNHFGTEAYFPFFRAEVETIRFPQLAPSP